MKLTFSIASINIELRLNRYIQFIFDHVFDTLQPNHLINNTCIINWRPAIEHRKQPNLSSVPVVGACHNCSLILFCTYLHKSCSFCINSNIMFISSVSWSNVNRLQTFDHQGKSQGSITKAMVLKLTVVYELCVVFWCRSAIDISNFSQTETKQTKTKP